MPKPRQDEPRLNKEHFMNIAVKSHTASDCTQAHNAPARALRIRALNDRLRREALGSMIMVTAGIAALDDEIKRAILIAVRDFDAFTPDNDPYCEHDFGSVDVAGITVFWKIEAYERSLTLASPDPSDPRVTRRVMTIMLAAEY